MLFTQDVTFVDESCICLNALMAVIEPCFSGCNAGYLINNGAMTCIATSACIKTQ